MILFKFFIENPVLSNSINPSLLDSVSSSGVYNTLCCLFSMKDCLLITSNVGSLFGDKTRCIRDNWITFITKSVENNNAKFVAINLQESGGKSYKLHSKDVVGLIDELRTHLLSLNYEVCRCFLDIDFERVEEYTALSSIFFVHKQAIGDVKQYSFHLKKFIPLTIDENAGSRFLLNTDLLNCEWTRKEKFARDFWKAFRWSRKGFLHTRWQFSNSRTVDLINVHLFHDESNLILLEDGAHYKYNRKKALLYALNSFDWTNSNLFIFGDFNFRLDLPAFVKSLTKDTVRNVVEESIDFVDSAEDSCFADCSNTETTSKPGGSSSEGENAARNALANCVSGKDSSSRPNSDHNKIAEPKANTLERHKNVFIEYRRKNIGALTDSKYLLKIGKKCFDYCDAEKLTNEWSAYQRMDRELEDYGDTKLHEFPINFIPTYPWSEDVEVPNRFMKTRAPAWCDRVLMNEHAYNNLCSTNNQDVTYDAIGQRACTGDHKPVMLAFSFTN